MPKSKREKAVPLSATQKKTRDAKEALVSTIRECVSQYGYVYAVRVDNMRNDKFKELRAALQSSSRFFAGKNKLMQLALGRTVEDEQRPGLAKLSAHLVQQNVLLFSNKPLKELKRVLAKHESEHYARHGNVATETIAVQAGPLPQFQHDMEPHLRGLGMSTRLQQGVIELMTDHVICREGDTLTSEQCRLLKHFEHKLATFKVSVVAVFDVEKGTLKVVDEE